MQSGQGALTPRRPPSPNCLPVAGAVGRCHCPATINHGARGESMCISWLLVGLGLIGHVAWLRIVRWISALGCEAHADVKLAVGTGSFNNCLSKTPVQAEACMAAVVGTICGKRGGWRSSDSVLMIQYRRRRTGGEQLQRCRTGGCTYLS